MSGVYIFSINILSNYIQAAAETKVICLFYLYAGMLVFSALSISSL